MISFFKGLLNKLKYAAGQHHYENTYDTLISKFRRVTPLSQEDVTEIGMLLQELSENPAYTKEKYAEFEELFISKTEEERRKLRQLSSTSPERISVIPNEKTPKYFPFKKENDVSYYVNGQIIYGDVNSSEEEEYFNQRNVDVLNREPLRKKKCDIECVVNECQKCIEVRLRKELTKRIHLDSQRAESSKRRKVLPSTGVVNRLNEQLGCPILIGRAVADDRFSVDDLTEPEKEKFLKWKQMIEEQKNRPPCRREVEQSPYIQTSKWIEPIASDIGDVQVPKMNNPFTQSAESTAAVFGESTKLSSNLVPAECSTDSVFIGAPQGVIADVVFKDKEGAEGEIPNPFEKKVSEHAEQVDASEPEKQSVGLESKNIMANPFNQGAAKDSLFNPFSKAPRDAVLNTMSKNETSPLEQNSVLANPFNIPPMIEPVFKQSDAPPRNPFQVASAQVQEPDTVTTVKLKRKLDTEQTHFNPLNSTQQNTAPFNNPLSSTNQQISKNAPPSFVNQVNPFQSGSFALPPTAFNPPSQDGNNAPSNFSPVNIFQTNVEDKDGFFSNKDSPTDGPRRARRRR